jgi:hypothetical protein
MVLYSNFTLFIIKKQAPQKLVWTIIQ